MEETYTCFLAVPSRLDISLIAGLLSASKVEYGTTFEQSSYFGQIPERIKEAIRKSDFLFAVLDSSEDSSNVLIELGMALGLGKPIFAVVAPTATTSLELKGVTTVQAELREVQAIRFHLEIFLKEALRHRRRRRQEHKRSAEPPKQPPDQRFTTAVLDHLVSLRTEVDLEKAIAGFLQEKGYQVTEEGNANRGFRPDIAVWLPSTPSALGNLLLIEIKRTQESRSGERAIVNTLRQYASNVGAQTAIILWQTERGDDAPTLHPGFPLVFSLPISTFVRLVETNDLVPMMIRERNKNVHGIT